MLSKSGSEIVKTIYKIGDNNLNKGLEKMLRATIENKKLKRIIVALGLALGGSSILNIKQYIDSKKSKTSKNEFNKEDINVSEIEDTVENMSDNEIAETIEEVVELANKENAEKNKNTVV